MGFFSWLLSQGGYSPATNSSPGKKHSAKVQIIGVRCAGGRQVRIVKRGSSPLWAEKGWTLKGGTLLGRYRASHNSYKGAIDTPFTSPQLTIYDIPMAVQNGPHGACFKEKAENSFAIHFSPVPVDVNAAILRVEHCLIEHGL